VGRAVVTLFAFSCLCFLVFLFPVLTGAAAFVLFLLASSSFLVGFVFCFDDSISNGARLAMGYLACVATLHIWTAALVFKNILGSTLFVVESVEPILELAQSRLSRLRLTDNLSADHSWYLVATIVLAVGLAALVSAVGIARNKRFGYIVWLILIALSAAASFRILFALATAPSTANSFYGDKWSPSPWWTTFWPSSSALACWIAWKGSRS